MMLVIHTSIALAIRRTHVNSGQDPGNFRNGPEPPNQLRSRGFQLLAALLQPRQQHQEALLSGHNYHVQHKRQVANIISVAPLPLRSIVASM